MTWRSFAPGIFLADTITKLPGEAFGTVVVSGSHGGRYPGYLAAKAGVRAVLLNDAGIGCDQAGIGSLAYLEALGIAATTLSHRSCTIGDTDDMLRNGRVSAVNDHARAVGVVEGLSCEVAARLLTGAPHKPADAPSIGEARAEVATPGARRRIVLLDSASLVAAEDTGQIVVTGSHGGLIGGNPALALRIDAFAAAFNDAGRPDGPGTSRLPALAQRGIAAMTVSSETARIGEAVSAFEDGIISAANNIALTRGARIGSPLAECLRLWALMPGERGTNGGGGPEPI